MLLGKDQYGRAVAETYIKPSIFSSKKNVSDMLLNKGLAYVYKQSGAVYGKGPQGEKRKDALLKMEAAAKAGKTGLWGAEITETPAEYKARLKEVMKDL